MPGGAHSGRIELNVELTALHAELRLARRRIGMIFQGFNLVDRLTVMENVVPPFGYLPRRAVMRRYP